MNPYVIAGGVAGGLWLFGQGPAHGPPQAQSAGDASTAAANALLAKRPIAGVSWTPEASQYYSANTNYIAMRDAFVGARGRLPGATVAPNGLTADELVEVMTAWLAAYDAGRSASHTNFGLVIGETSTPNNAAEIAWGNRTCAEVGQSTIPDNGLSQIGTAACALSRYRDYIANASGDAATNALVVSGQATIEAFRLMNALASEMDGADYTTPGVRNDQQGWNWSDIPGALEHAGEESAKAVADLAGKGAGAIASFVVDSNVFWFAVLGFAAYMVLR